MVLLKLQQQPVQFLVVHNKRHSLKREEFYCFGGFPPEFQPSTLHPHVYQFSNGKD